jgi:hypothetical protein
VTVSRSYTDDQITYLMKLAFDCGRSATYREDLAELGCAWNDNAERRRTYEQRVTQRRAQMEADAARSNERLGRPPGYRYDGGPVDWETGSPLRRAER